MKQVLIFAALLSLACATQVEAFSFTLGDWITTLWNRFMLQFCFTFIAPWSFIAAFFGAPLWFTTNAWSLVTTTFALPAYGQFQSIYSASAFTNQ